MLNNSLKNWIKHFVWRCKLNVLFFAITLGISLVYINLLSCNSSLSNSLYFLFPIWYLAVKEKTKFRMTCVLEISRIFYFNPCNSLLCYFYLYIEFCNGSGINQFYTTVSIIILIFSPGTLTTLIISDSLWVIFSVIVWILFPPPEYSGQWLWRLTQVFSSTILVQFDSFHSVIAFFNFPANISMLLSLSQNSVHFISLPILPCDVSFPHKSFLLNSYSQYQTVFIIFFQLFSKIIFMDFWVFRKMFSYYCSKHEFIVPCCLYDSPRKVEAISKTRVCQWTIHIHI